MASTVIISSLKTRQINQCCNFGTNNDNKKIYESEPGQDGGKWLLMSRINIQNNLGVKFHYKETILNFGIRFAQMAISSQ